VKAHSELKRKLDEILKVSNNGYRIAVALSLIFVFSLVIGYYFISRLPPAGYTTVYVLDYQHKKAIDYPELLVVNGNNTFDVWVDVENHMGTRQSFEVLQKVVAGSISSFPVEANAESSYTSTIENGATWETLATVSINEPGSYSVVFELWIQDDNTFKFTYNYCVLNIEVVDQI
jgi:uncharacterized membrane protein